MLLICFRQQHTVAEAIAGALAQTYSPLEILISDDASDDDSWQVIQRSIEAYGGPHQVRAYRNERNLGIGAHLSALADRASGELLFITAGDDVSLPQRCEKTVAAWQQSGCRLDLIASPLIDIDAGGSSQGLMRPADLSRWRSADDWLREQPYVIGAGQAWTRRLLERFGPLPEGTVAEDWLMAFRAIVSGGAITLDEALVRYRRGGISRRRRALHARQVVERLKSNARHAVIELEQLRRDAGTAGVDGPLLQWIAHKLARERHIAAQLQQAAPFGARLQRLLADRDVPFGLRLRVFLYATTPWLFAPFFALKRISRRAGD